MKELLEFLKEQKIPAAVATSTGKNSAEMVLKKAGVYDVLSAHMYGDMLKASKPEPDIFLEAAKKIGREPKECLVIEDSISGILAGKAAGGYVIYIPDVMKVPEEEMCIRDSISWSRKSDGLCLVLKGERRRNVRSALL